METEQELDPKRYTQLLYQRRYLFVAVVVIVTSISIAVSYILPKVYEAKTTVLVESNYVNQLMKNIAITPSIEDRVRALEAILKSRALVLKVIGDLDLELTRKSDIQVEKLVQAFQKATDIKYGIEMSKSAGRNMDMFTVSFRYSNPATARDYVNILIRRYIEENLSQNRDESYDANKFLLEQINLFKNKISTIEADIARLSRQPGIVSAVKEDRMLVLQKRLETLRLQYTDNHPEIMKLKAEMEAIRNQSTGSRRPVDVGRMAEQQQPDLNLEDSTRGSDMSHGLGVSETGKISDKPAQKTQKQGIESSTSQTSNKVKIAELERDRETYKKIYEDLLATMGRSEVSSHIEVQNKGGTFKILEPAILPFIPVRPDRVKIILFGLLGGIGGGIAFIILLDSMDKSIKTVDNLKTLGLPILAVIPHIQSSADVQKKKRLDLLLYATAGVYLVCVVGLVVFEFLKRGLL